MRKNGLGVRRHFSKRTQQQVTFYHVPLDDVTSEQNQVFQRDVSRFRLVPLMLWSELLEVSVPGRAGWDTFS